MTKLLQRPFHTTCFACGRAHPEGLHLTYEVRGNRITCKTQFDSKYQSYDGIVHGGMLALLADSAMVNLVYACHGGRPLTCRLQIDYHEPVRISEEVTVEAVITRTVHKMSWCECRIHANTRVCVEAYGVFKLENTAFHHAQAME